jgi:hypothetical protein
MASRLLHSRGRYDRNQWDADYATHVARRNMLSRRISVPLPVPSMPLSPSQSSPRMNNSRPASARPATSRQTSRRADAQRELDELMATHGNGDAMSHPGNDDINDNPTGHEQSNDTSPTRTVPMTSTATGISTGNGDGVSSEQLESPTSARQRLRPASAHSNSFVFSPRIARIYGVNVPAPPSKQPNQRNIGGGGRRSIRSADPRLRAEPPNSARGGSQSPSSASSTHIPSMVAFEEDTHRYPRSRSRDRPSSARYPQRSSSSRSSLSGQQQQQRMRWQQALAALEDEAIVQGMTLDDDGNYVNTHPRYAYAPAWNGATTTSSSSRSRLTSATTRSRNDNPHAYHDAEVAYYNDIATDAARQYQPIDPYARTVSRSHHVGWAPSPSSSSSARPTNEFYPLTARTTPSSTATTRVRERARSVDMPDPEFLIKLDDEYIVKE